MKRYKAHFITVLGILSFLSVPTTPVAGINRHIASVMEENATFPRYEAFALKIKPESIQEEKDLTEEQFQLKISELKEVLEKSRKEFKQNESDEKIVKAHRQELETLVARIFILEAYEKELQIKESNLLPHKEVMESLLKDLDASEARLARKDEPKAQVASSQQNEEIIEEIKEEPKIEICKAEEKQRTLTLQVEELMKQQLEIVKIMSMMSQSLINLQQQQMLFFSQGPAWKTNPYQYQEPVTAGNWVYYPRGFRPEQNNIFSPPNTLQGSNPLQSFYPDQIHQQPLPQPQDFGPNSWMLRGGDFGQNFSTAPPFMSPQNAIQSFGPDSSPNGFFL